MTRPPVPFRRALLCLFLVGAWIVAAAVPCASALCCVWKVTDDAGHTLYLAGSVHVLRAADYPLPAPYEAAYRASAALAFETDLFDEGNHFDRAIGAVARYPHGGKLKDHVDPRTYAYILRVIGNVHGASAPEKRIENLRPWAIALSLESPGGSKEVSAGSGVEAHFIEKAKRDHKPMAGLVPFRDQVAIISQMSDADGEAMLLLAFIHLNTNDKVYGQTVADWKRGDVARIAKTEEEEFRDAPGLRQRILTDRNLRWMPKLEDYLHSGKTWMVIAGAAHMSGGDSVPTLLRAKGYHVEQL